MVLFDRPRTAARLSPALALALGAGLALVAPVARAQTAASGADAATAQALFDDGKKALAAKDFASACPKLAESQRLDPGGGTALALALCYEGQGKTASAWAAFREAANYAKKDRRGDREASANEHIAALEPSIPKLLVAVRKPTPGLVLKRDGTPMGEGQVGTALPLDPGEHVIEATAPQRKAFRVTVTLPAQGTLSTVEVPELAEEDRGTPAPTAVPQSKPGPARPAPEPEDNTNRYILGGVVGGAGVVVGTIGLILGASARSQWNNASSQCPGNRCPNQTLIDNAKSAGNTADAATVMLIVGGAAVATGAVILLTAPSTADKPRAQVHLAPMLGDRMGALTLGGTL